MTEAFDSLTRKGTFAVCATQDAWWDEEDFLAETKNFLRKQLARNANHASASSSVKYVLPERYEAAGVEHYLTSVAEFMLRHRDHLLTQVVGVKALGALIPFAVQAPAPSKAGDADQDLDNSLDISSPVAATVCAWRRLWADPTFRSTAAPFAVAVLSQLTRGAERAHVGWWPRDDARAAVPPALRPTVVTHVLGEILAFYGDKQRIVAKATCEGLQGAVDADWCGFLRCRTAPCSLFLCCASIMLADA